MLRLFYQVNGIGRNRTAMTGDHISVFAGRLQIPFAFCESSICAFRMGGRENSILIKNSLPRRILVFFDSGTGLGKLLSLLA